jgi:hypothetical protein
MRRLAFVICLSMGAVWGVRDARSAGDQYHVYKLGNGECEIDTRSHEQMKSQRSTDDCKGHFDSRTDAEKRRKELVSRGACKCPSGQNC